MIHNKNPTKKEKQKMLKASEIKHLIINEKNIKTMLKENEKKELTTNAKKLAKWFKIELTISIFGQVIIHWVYPPQNNE